MTPAPPLTRRLRALSQHEEFRRFVKFLALGLVNTAFGYAVFALLILLGLGPQIALALSFAIGVLFNYVLSARLIFAQRGFRKLPLYALAYVGVYFLNAFCLHTAIDAGLQPLIAQALLTPLAAVLTFVLISRVMR